MYLLTDKGIEYIKKKSSFRQAHCKHKYIKGELCLENGDTRIGYAEIFTICKKCGQIISTHKIIK